MQFPSVCELYCWWWFFCRNHHHWLLVAQIYLWKCLCWGKTSYQLLVLDFPYLFYTILVPMPLTIILFIYVVDVVISKYLAGSLPIWNSLVTEQGSIPSLPQIHLEGSCVALSWKFWILFVPHLYPHWVCVLFFWYWGDIVIQCGLYHIRMSSSRKGYCIFSF